MEEFYEKTPVFAKVKETLALKKDKGEAIHCSVTGGQAKFSKGWFPIKNTEFDIYLGDIISVDLQKKSSEEMLSVQARFDPSGQKMVFCPEQENHKEGERLSCYSLYALDDDYVLGIKRTFDVPKLIRGSTMLCKYAQNPIKE